MTHEPECGHSHPELYGHLGKCRCDILRSAYQRGREEVSQNILQLVSNSKYCELPFYDIDHDGSECCIRMKTIRKVLSGEWTVEDPTLNNDWHMKGQTMTDLFLFLIVCQLSGITWILRSKL